MASDRLLVLDDEPDFARFVRRVAEDVGYAVEVTMNPAEFRRAYLEFGPTLIMLDIVMPDADGIEMVRWLADQKALAGIILVSGFERRYLTAAREIAQIKGLDVVAALTKPVDVATLRAVLRARVSSQMRA